MRVTTGTASRLGLNFSTPTRWGRWAGVAARELGDLKGAVGYLNTAVQLDAMFKQAADLRDRTAKELAAAK